MGLGLGAGFGAMMPGMIAQSMQSAQQGGGGSGGAGAAAATGAGQGAPTAGGAFCTNCGQENADGAAFCDNCGTGLASGCPNCGAENRPEGGARFTVLLPRDLSPNDGSISYGQAVVAAAILHAENGGG